MGRALLANNAATTLSAPIVSTSATTFTVVSAISFPSPTGGQYFYCTLLDAGTAPEIVQVTNVTGTTFTCVRAQDNTTAKTFSSSATVKINLTAAVIAELATAGGSSGDPSYSAATYGGF